MKEKDAIVEENERLMVVFVEKPDATYGPARSGSLLVEGFMGDLQPRLDHIRDHFLGQLRDGTLSPVGYHMGLLALTEADMATRMDLSRRQVRKHMKPEGFSRLSLPLLARYAELLGVEVEELRCVSLPDGGIFTPPEPEEAS